MADHVQFWKDKEHYTYISMDRHIQGNRYSVPGLAGCFGLICVPRFNRGHFFMAHSAFGSGWKDVMRAFLHYWGTYNYDQQSHNNFTILYKENCAVGPSPIPDNAAYNKQTSKDGIDSIKAFFARKSVPYPGVGNFAGLKGNFALSTSEGPNGSFGGHHLMEDREILRAGLHDAIVAKANGAKVHTEFKIPWPTKTPRQERPLTWRYLYNKEDGPTNRTAAINCAYCQKAFNAKERPKNRCRNCNAIICPDCSVNLSGMFDLRYKKRLCQLCITEHRNMWIWPNQAEEAEIVALNKQKMADRRAFLNNEARVAEELAAQFRAEVAAGARKFTDSAARAGNKTKN